MIVHDVVQGSAAWIRLRTGIPTASSFDRIVTPGGKLSASREAYMRELLAEVLMGEAIQQPTIAAMQRGRELESSAAKFYEITTDREITRVGFVTTDDGRYGASPDGFVGEDGCVEFKCPLPHVHIGYLVNRSVDKAYYPQIQGQLLVTGRQWVDIVSYHPKMPMCLIRVERDEQFIEILKGAIETFCDEFAEQVQSLRDKGYLVEQDNFEDPLGVSESDLNF